MPQIPPASSVFPFFRFSVILFLTSLVADSALSQSPSGPPKIPSFSMQSAVMDQEQFISYWTTETGWSSELQLRNNANDQDLVVTASLRLPNGAETPLSPVTVKPQEVRSVDIASAAFTSAAPQDIGTYGSLVLRYRSPYAAGLYAAMMIRRTGHAVAFHIDGIGESQEFDIGSREGIWWLPTETATDYLVLSNQGKNALPLTLSLYDASGREAKQKVILGAAETSRLSVRTLLQRTGPMGTFGGIKLSTTAHVGSLNTLHFLYDEDADFSAIMKMFDFNPKAPLEERDYAKTGTWTLRAPMLALPTPDPALGFPNGTTLHPQIFIRNNTAKLLTASLRFNWRAAEATGKTAGPQLRLSPLETRRVDVTALQQSGAIPKNANWASVTLTTNSLPDEIMAVAASYDSTWRYGAQTPFSDQLTFKWEGGMWEYDAYHDSIITAGNGGTKPTRAAFTIFYNQGTQKYELEQALQPDEQMWIDIGKLIREQVPDKNGNTLPVNLTSGSYEFRDLLNRGVGTLFEGKVIYDKTYGHAAYGCAACCGYNQLAAALTYNPLGVPFQGTAPQGVTAPDMCQGGAIADVSDIFWNHWSTANSSIATADTHGTHTGVAVGSTTSSTNGCLNNNDARLNCPLKCVTPSGGANVKPRVVIQGSPTHIYIGQDSTVVHSNANSLFSQGTPSGGTYTWSTPDTTTSFDNVNAQDPHVQATNYTGKMSDTTLTVNYSYNGVAAAPASVSLTKLIFERLCCDSVIQVQSYNGPTQYGYVFQASYNVIANPGSVQVSDGSGISTNEQVTQTSSNTGNITPTIAQGALTANSQLLDYPMAILSNTQLPSGLSIVDSQSLFVGGIYVRNNTLTWSSTGVTVTNNGPTN